MWLHLTTTSAAHTQSLRMHTHIQRTTTLHAKTAQEVEGYKRSRLKECGADGPAASIYDTLGQSDAYAVNRQLGTYWKRTLREVRRGCWVGAIKERKRDF